MANVLQIFRLAGFRYFGRHKVRTLLTILGVVFGVAVTVFGPSLAMSMSNGVYQAIDDIAGKAQLEIRGEQDGFDASILDVVREIDGIDIAAPVVETGGVVVGNDELILMLGIDSTIDASVRTYTFADGNLPQAGEIVLTSTYAEEKGYAVGDAVAIFTPGGFRSMRVSGVLAAQGFALLNGGDLLLLNIEDALALNNASLSTISLLLGENTNRDAVMAEIAPLLPEGAEVDVPASRGASYQVTDMFLTFLMWMIGGLAVALSVTLIFNTMRVAVMQRRKEIGVLRALGMTRKQTQQLFVIEATIMGVIASALGVVLGAFFVSVAGDLPLLPPIQAGIPTPPLKPQVSIAVLPLAFMQGVIFSMLAGWLPSRAASNVDPVEALTPQRSDIVQVGINRRQAILGLVMLVSIIVISLTPMAKTMLIAVSLIYGALIAVTILLPTIFYIFGRFLPGVMQSAFGIAGYVASENITKRPGRVMTTALMILIGLWAGLVTSSSNFGYSGFTQEWNASENIADIVIAGPGQKPLKPELTLAEGIQNEVNARDDVAGSYGERLTETTFADIKTSIRAIEMHNFLEMGGALLWRHGDEEEAYQLMLERPALLMTSYLASNSGHDIGDTVEMPTPSGHVPFTLVGILLGSADIGTPGEAGIVLDLAVYQQYWNDDSINRLSVKMNEGVDLNEARREFLSTFSPRGAIVYNASDLSAAFQDGLVSIISTSQIMTLMFLTTIIIGVANTLIIVVLDRRREIGTLRALGMNQRQIAFSVVLEAALIVLIVALVAIPIGVFNNNVNSIVMEEFISVRFAISVTEIGISLLIVLITAMLAAYIPARMAGRQDVILSLRYE